MSKPPTCRDCTERIAWFRFEPTGRRKPFEPKPVDGRTHVGATAYPVEGGVLAWRLGDLVADLMVRRECGHDDAQDEAYDMPFYVPHDCRTNPERTAL